MSEEEYVYYMKLLHDFCETHNSQNEFQIDKTDVQLGLMEVLKNDSMRDLMRRKISKNEVARLLHGFEFKKFHPELLATITFDPPLIPIDPNTRCYFEKAKVKFKGEQWVIHKNDLDPFPSNPHAHNYEKRWKLDLSNGDIYIKTDHVGKISKKDFEKLRVAISNKGIVLPELSD